MNRRVVYSHLAFKLRSVYVVCDQALHFEWRAKRAARAVSFRLTHSGLPSRAAYTCLLATSPKMERLLQGESASTYGELRTEIGQTQNKKLLNRKFNWCIKHNVPTWNGFVPSCCFETFNIHENSVGFAVDDFTFLLNSGDSKIWNKSMGKQVKLMAMQKQLLLYGGVSELVIYGESCILIDYPSA